jgi:hypothetical protein
MPINLNGTFTLSIASGCPRILLFVLPQEPISSICSWQRSSYSLCLLSDGHGCLVFTIQSKGGGIYICAFQKLVVPNLVDGDELHQDLVAD